MKYKVTYFIAGGDPISVPPREQWYDEAKRPWELPAAEFDTPGDAEAFRAEVAKEFRSFGAFDWAETLRVEPVTQEVAA